MLPFSVIGARLSCGVKLVLKSMGGLFTIGSIRFGPEFVLNIFGLRLTPAAVVCRGRKWIAKVQGRILSSQEQCGANESPTFLLLTNHTEGRSWGGQWEERCQGGQGSSGSTWCCAESGLRSISSLGQATFATPSCCARSAVFLLSRDTKESLILCVCVSPYWRSRSWNRRRAIFTAEMNLAKDIYKHQHIKKTVGKTATVLDFFFYTSS